MLFKQAFGFLCPKQESSEILTLLRRERRRYQKNDPKQETRIGRCLEQKSDNRQPAAPIVLVALIQSHYLMLKLSNYLVQNVLNGGEGNP